jgi:hypothetical protein
VITISSFHCISIDTIHYLQACANGFYANAVNFLLIAEKAMQKSGEKWEKNVEKLIKKMKKEIVDLNNQYVTKKHVIIGGNYKVKCSAEAIEKNVNSLLKQSTRNLI